MSTLKEVCSGLPVDPIPEQRTRDPNVPHAPVRRPNLCARDQKVSFRLLVLDCIAMVYSCYGVVVRFNPMGLG